MTTPTNRLRTRARLLHTIGSDLISSESVAIVELVKNAYDADASRVVLNFGSVDQGGRLEVLDNGTGMTRSVVENVWLEIATPNRTKKRTSNGGRRILGEKGIGRFAAARLADELSMITRTSRGPETHVSVDWRQYQDPNKFLDEVEVAVSEHADSSFTGRGRAAQLWDELDLPRSRTGTLMALQGLTRAWTAEDFTALRRDLSRLIRPGAFKSEPDFAVYLELPADLEHLAGSIEPPRELSNPPYLLSAKVKATGKVDYTLLLPGRDPETGTAQVDSARKHRDSAGRLLCGPLAFELRVFDRDRDAVTRMEAGSGLPIDTKSFRESLDQLAGISVYRDGFRVLPFGERGDDWLNLDARRVNNPGNRLSNAQVIGAVLITSAENPRLKDQTNREGLIQGTAYEAFRAVITDLLVLLESRRTLQRREDKPSKRQRPNGRSLFAAFTLADVVDAVRNSPNPDPALVRLVEQADDRIAQGVEHVRDVLSRYQRLATLGQLVDEIVHDGQSSVGRIRRATREGKRLVRGAQCDTDKAEALVTAVDQQSDYLGILFRRIAPFGGRRRGRPKKVSAQQTVQQAVDVLSSAASRAGVTVTVSGEDSEITVDPAEMQEILINLIDNAIYWVQHVPERDRRIDINVARGRNGSLLVTVDDTGPGVPVDIQEAIFDPYFSSKPDGGGLGLSIAGELVGDAYDGSLDLVESDLGGAAFRVTFNRRV